MSDLTKEKPFVSIENLQVQFKTRRGLVKAVRDISFSLEKGETLALVGESGCGKSVTAHSINQLIPMPPGEITGGKIFFRGRNLLEASAREMEAIRGQQITMIFQEPMTSLNPVFPIGDQIGEVFMTHQGMNRKEARKKAVELLDLVKIPSPEKRARDYPHQLSGGMRQRAMIAMALASPEPGLLIADEPTTALDVTIQAQILDLLKDLNKRVEMALLLITHDMGVVAETADKVVVMYAGRIMEQGLVKQIFANPSHPYTLGLLNSLPSNRKYRGAARLEAIEGNVPDLLTLGEGCPFANRCPYADGLCGENFPDKTVLGPDHLLYCHHHEAAAQGREA